MARRALANRLKGYRPYSKQREFHSLGTVRERLLLAGNQLGKSYCGAAETAIHATGRYPDWWDGRAFDKAPKAWAGSETGAVTRDTCQRLLVGDPKDEATWGQGMIPKACLVDYGRRPGVADALDYVVVRNGGGGDVQAGHATIGFRSYDQARTAWQGETLDFLWFDEEPPEEIYSEGLTRTNATRGIVFVTFTPLKGVSSVVRRFLMEKSPDRATVTMTIDDAEHYTDEDRERISASYQPHEREARLKGVPIMGSGLVFPVPEKDIAIRAFEIPPHWPVLGGLDFGWEHPTAAVRIAWDRDADILYVTNAYRRQHETPLIHAGAVKSWGANMPWAWPHDGLQHDKTSGEQLAVSYRTNGLNMMPFRATFEDGTNGVEAGVSEMLQRMQTGRLKVFDHLNEWFEEFRLYHRENGLIVKLVDDLLSATRYAMMMRRFAKPVNDPPDEHYPGLPTHSGGWLGA
jgi:phage terminase large subunit-like protein